MHHNVGLGWHADYHQTSHHCLSLLIFAASKLSSFAQIVKRPWLTSIAQQQNSSCSLPIQRIFTTGILLSRCPLIHLIPLPPWMSRHQYAKKLFKIPSRLLESSVYPWSCSYLHNSWFQSPNSIRIWLDSFESQISQSNSVNMHAQKSKLGIQT